MAQALVVQRLNGAIQRINLYPLAKYYQNLIYPMKSAIHPLNNWAMKIRCGLHHIGVILVFSQANICRLGLIVRVAQLNLKVSQT